MIYYISQGRVEAPIRTGGQLCYNSVANLLQYSSAKTYQNIMLLDKVSEIFVKKSSFYHTPLHSTPPLGGFPSEYRHPFWYGKTRMVSLPEGEKISKISLFVLAQLTNDNNFNSVTRDYCCRAARRQ